MIELIGGFGDHVIAVNCCKNACNFAPLKSPSALISLRRIGIEGVIFRIQS
jgi:hypothetical protein